MRIWNNGYDWKEYQVAYRFRLYAKTITGDLAYSDDEYFDSNEEVQRVKDKNLELMKHNANIDRAFVVIEFVEERPHSVVGVDKVEQ